MKEGRVEAVPAGKADLVDLRSIVSHCLKDSALPLDPDNKFAIVYNAARTLAVIAAAASGYRIKQRCGGHYNTFLALKAAMGSSIVPMADYLDDCRSKRNELSYGAAHVVTDTEVEELLAKTKELESLVENWIATHQLHLKP